MDANKPGVSEREQHGLRETVKTCNSERINPGVTSGDGTPYPETRFWDTTEYDEGGRVLVRRSRNSNGSEWAARYTYDAVGRLLKTGWGTEGESPQETVYSYDAQGRPLEIATSGSQANPVRFQYDERGRKTKVQVSRPEDYRPNAAVAGNSPFWAADRAPNMPGGGTATTSYDDQDRALEVVVRDFEGEVCSRTVRIYDADGRISEEKSIIENLEMIISAEVRAQILTESGATREDLREHLAKALHGRLRQHSVVFKYDAHGRQTETHRQTFAGDDLVEITYNEHGDQAVQITRSTHLEGDIDSPNRSSVYSEVRYSYQYDIHGNWIEQDTSFRDAPDGEFTSSTRVLRTLTYY